MKKNPRILFFSRAICAFALLAASVSAQAQTAPPAAPAPAGIVLNMKDGKTVSTASVRRNGDMVMATVQIGTGSGEIGYPTASIAKIDFPQPPQIKTAGDLLTQGKYADVLAQLEPVVTNQAPFKDVQGNWWAPAVKLKLKALVSLQKDAEAEALVKELASVTGDPELLLAARVQAGASLARKGQHDKALAIYDEVIKQNTAEETLAMAWLEKGLSLAAMKEWDAALLAYLHLPVLYPTQKALMPQALLGSARAYRQLDDNANAEKACQEVIKTFSTAPEAAAAKTELQKIQNDSTAKK